MAESGSGVRFDSSSPQNRYASMSEDIQMVQGLDEESSFCRDICTVYQTPQKLRIRSKFLQIPFIVINLSLFGFIITYELIYKLEILELMQAEGSSTVWLSEPKHDFWTCTNVDTDCDPFVKPDSEFKYCKKDAYTDGCKYFDRHAVAEGKFENHLFVATNILTLEQNKSRDEVKWKTIRNYTHAVKGIEDYMLQIRHSFTTAAHFKSYNNFGAAGFLVYRSAESSSSSSSASSYNHPLLGKIAKLERLPCAAYEKDGTIVTRTCSNNSKFETYNYQWDQITPCQTQQDFLERHSNPACMKTQFGDYLSLEKVFEAAGIGTLDDKDPFLQKPWRYTGMSLVMEITTVNGDPHDFWDPPIGPKLKYFYEFYETSIHPDVGGNTYSGFHYRNGVPDDNGFADTHRIIRQSTGIPIFVRSRVHFREFSVVRAFTALLVCVTAFRLSSIFIEHVLVRIYRACGQCGNTRLGYVSLTYRFFTFREAPEPDHVGKDIHHGRKSMIDHHEKKTIQRRLDKKNTTHMKKVGDWCSYFHCPQREEANSYNLTNEDSDLNSREHSRGASS